MVYHYKSIDTWLEGVSKSFCAQHAWSSSNLQWAPGKKSVFSIDDDYDEADLNAPDIDEDMEADEAGEESKGSAGTKVSNQCFVGQGNNAELPKEVLATLGYKIMPRGMLFSNDYRFKWTQTSMEVNYMHFKEGAHIANHISNSGKVFTNKISTLETIQNLVLNL